MENTVSMTRAEIDAMELIALQMRSGLSLDDAVAAAQEANTRLMNRWESMRPAARRHLTDTIAAQVWLRCNAVPRSEGA